MIPQGPGMGGMGNMGPNVGMPNSNYGFNPAMPNSMMTAPRSMGTTNGGIPMNSMQQQQQPQPRFSANPTDPSLNALPPRPMMQMGGVGSTMVSSAPSSGTTPALNQGMVTNNAVSQQQQHPQQQHKQKLTKNISNHNSKNKTRQEH